jgi:hypothetical protein
MVASDGLVLDQSIITKAYKSPLACVHEIRGQCSKSCCTLPWCGRSDVACFKTIKVNGERYRSLHMSLKVIKRWSSAI